MKIVAGAFFLCCVLTPGSVEAQGPDCIETWVEVTPCTLPDLDTMPTKGIGRKVFMIYNPSWMGELFEVAPACGGEVLNCVIDDDYPYMYTEGNDSSLVGVTYTTGTLSNMWGQVGFTVTNWQGVLPVELWTLVRDEAFVNTSTYKRGLWNPSTPVNGFGLVFRHSTPAYYTLDTERNISVIYNSHRYRPHVTVSSTLLFPKKTMAVTGITLTVSVNGVPIPFVNGETVLHFKDSLGGVHIPYSCLYYPQECREVSYGGTSGQIAGTLNLSSYPNQDIMLQASVVVTYEDASTRTWNSTHSIFVASNAMSSIGAGWEVAGLQRLYPASDSTQRIVVAHDGRVLRYTLGTKIWDGSILTYEAGPAKYRQTYLDGTVVTFSAQGLMESVRDRFNNVVLMTYDGSGRLTSVKDPMWTRRGNTGRHWALSYYTDSVVVAEAGGTGLRRVVYHKNGQQRITQIVDPDGLGTMFSYDTAGRLAGITDRRGGARRFGYWRSTGLLLADTLPEVPTDNGIGGTTPGKPVMTFASWELHLPTTATATVPASFVKTTTDSMTLPLNRKARYVFDASGMPLMAALHGRYPVYTSYYGWSPMVVSYGQNHAEVDSFFYAHPSEMYGMRPSRGAMTYYTYGAFQQLSGVSGDEVQTMIAKIHPTHGTTDTIWTIREESVYDMERFTYDSLGRRIAHVDAVGAKDTIYYDSVTGNANRSWREGGTRTRRLFDAVGRVIIDSATGRSPITTTYDTLNRVVTVHDGVYATPVRFVYDALYRTSVRNAANAVVDSVVVDALGKVQLRWLPGDVTGTTYRYNVAGELVAMVNRRGQTISYSYDAAGRLLARAYGGSVDSFLVSADDNYRRTRSADITTISEYVPADRESRQTFVIGSDTIRGVSRTQPWLADTVPMVYTRNGQRFLQWHHAYDFYSGALRQVGWRDSTEAIKWLTNLYYSEGMRLSYIDDPAPWPHAGSRWYQYTSRGTTLAGGADYSFSAVNLQTAYQFDSLDRIRTRQDRLPANNIATRRRAFVYDAMGRLVGDSLATAQPCATWPGIADPAFGWTNRCGVHVYTEYAYDSTGNRITPSATYANNRILTQGSLLFAHDADGNVTRKYTSSGTVNTVYAWDALSRLMGVTDSVAGRTVTFFYDADGQLVRRAVNGVTNRYWLWQGGNIAFELDSVLNRRLAYSYLGTDWPIVALTQGNDILYPRRDTEGNLIWVQGTWGQRVDYDPWGGPSTDVTWMDWSLLWKGLLWQDRALVGQDGLYFMRARWYDPEIGRFLSPDPIGVAGGLNPYVFAGSDPVNSRDPSGLIIEIRGKKLRETIAEWRKKYPAVEAVFSALEKSTDLFVFVDVSETPEVSMRAIGGGWSIGGLGPLEDEQRFVDLIAEELKLERKAKGVSLVDRTHERAKTCPMGVIATHEATHLLGLTQGKKNKKYPHSSQRFEPIKKLEEDYKCHQVNPY